MRVTVNNIKIRADKPQDESHIVSCAAKMLRVSPGDISGTEICKRSIDARDKDDIRYVYTIECDIRNAERILKESRIKNVSAAVRPVYRIPEASYTGRPVIIGAGPAGLFCALICVEAGLKPLIAERGKRIGDRKSDVEEFWNTGVLIPDSNVQFGEGGAGTFSDGKLNTLVHDKEGRCRYVLETFVRFGAPANILYDAKPHVGTDLLEKVITNIREYLLSHGTEMLFETCLTDILISGGCVSGAVFTCKDETTEIKTDRLILATGHSARDTFKLLYDKGVCVTAKPFAAGLRIEHPRSFVDTAQYGIKGAKLLPSASYKLTARSGDRGVYSFCMCPGGYVVNASSEPGMLAVNGMSYSGRKGDNSNSAIIVTVTPEDYPSDHPLAGIEFQRELEHKAYEIGSGRVPYQRYGDYVSRIRDMRGSKTSEELFIDAVSGESFGSGFVPGTKGMNVSADLSALLPCGISESLIEGMKRFGRMIHGFNSADAYLSGVESRTSSPVKIPRGDDGMSVNISGLYPCGEGAGYAGGITSAAMDGMLIAEKVLM